MHWPSPRIGEAWPGPTGSPDQGFLPFFGGSGLAFSSGSTSFQRYSQKSNDRMELGGEPLAGPNGESHYVVLALVIYSLLSKRWLHRMYFSCDDGSILGHGSETLVYCSESVVLLWRD